MPKLKTFSLVFQCLIETKNKNQNKDTGALGTASYIFVTELLVVSVQVVLENKLWGSL